MSGEGRQTVSFPAPNAVSAPAVGSTQAGTCSVWPAAERTSNQVAACVAEPVHCVAACWSGAAVPSATCTIPVSGRIASGEIAFALTCAVTVPIGVPGACVSVAGAEAGA